MGQKTGNRIERFAKHSEMVRMFSIKDAAYVSDDLKHEQQPDNTCCPGPLDEKRKPTLCASSH
jgi:hypothetical protein